MKSNLTALTCILLVVTALAIFSQAAPARASEFDVQINIAEYDVIYLADFFDVKTDRLSSLASGLSVTITEKTVAAGPTKVYLYVESRVQLRGGNGDAGDAPLVEGFTKDFDIPGSITLSARDFAKDGIVSPNVVGSYHENTKLKKKIRDMALSTSTAPAGSYTLLIQVFSTSPTRGTLYGSDTKTVVVSFSTPDEAFVEITEPKSGSCFLNLAPMFSWTTAEPKVRVRVFEAGLNHRSPQDALTGSNICLDRDVTGATTLTYPADAARQLQENKAYVLQVESKITSTRGEIGNKSKPVVFRITNDETGKMLDNFFNSLSGDASSTYSSLRADPSDWIPWFTYGSMTLDGAVLNPTDLQAFLNTLAAQQDVKIELEVENQ